MDATDFQNEQLRRAAEAANRGDWEQSFYELGQGLHTVQDDVAHDGASWIDHFALKLWMVYRDFYPTQEDYDLAEKGSKDYIDRYIKMLEKNPFKENPLCQ